MIVGKDFIWLHFPKCAGTETEQILRRNFAGDHNIAFDAIDPERVIWHHSIPIRKQYDPTFDVRGRAVICNIRRLPNWLLSRVHDEKVRSPHLVVTREMFARGRFFRLNGQVLSADDLMNRYTAYPVTHWIRTENFPADFLAVFSKYLPLSGIDPASEFKQANTNKMDYIRDVEFYFTRDELALLYRANPVWADMERKVYGTLPSADAAVTATWQIRYPVGPP
jgi:hypothetical protein